MPHWLIVSLVVLLVAPGVAIVLFGVYALFRTSGSDSPATQPETLPAAEPAPAASFSSSPVPPLTIDSFETPPMAEPLDADLFATSADPVIDADIESPAANPMLPAPEPDDKDVT
jgi:hypothetical protein